MAASPGINEPEQKKFNRLECRPLALARTVPCRARKCRAMVPRNKSTNMFRFSRLEFQPGAPANRIMVNNPSKQLRALRRTEIPLVQMRNRGRASSQASH
jgi:hypothetical protein